MSICYHRQAMAARESVVSAIECSEVLASRESHHLSLIDTKRCITQCHWVVSMTA
jgi:hypothetical protein